MAEPATTISGAITKALSAIKDFPLWFLIAIALSLIVFLSVPEFSGAASQQARTWITVATVTAVIFAVSRFGSVVTSHFNSYRAEAKTRRNVREERIRRPLSAEAGKIVDDVGTSKLLDLLMRKQTHFYTLWGVYTAVQFTAGGFGTKDTLSAGVVYAVILGVWAFNLGHLGFVLSCVQQISKLRFALNHRLAGTEKFKEAARDALADMQESDFFWRFYANKRDRSKYILNTLTHVIIDSCASIALLYRASLICFSCGAV